MVQQLQPQDHAIIAIIAKMAASMTTNLAILSRYGLLFHAKAVCAAALHCCLQYHLPNPYRHASKQAREHCAPAQNTTL